MDFLNLMGVWQLLMGSDYPESVEKDGDRCGLGRGFRRR